MIAQVENGILGRLKAASTAGVLGYAYRTADSYPADWDLYLADKALTYPGCWAVFGEAAPEVVTEGSVQMRASFGLVVAAQNMRNETAQRHGKETAGANEVGSYQLALDAIRILHGSDLGLPIGKLKAGEIRFVRPTAAMLKANVSMLAVQFTTTFTVDSAGFDPDDVDLADFVTFNAAWDVPPFRDPPAADLTTTTTLETD